MKYFIVVLLTLLTLACKVEAAENAGDVKTLSGTVQIQRGKERITPAVGDLVQVSDKMYTGADGSIGISFVDGTRLSLGPSSEVDLRNYLFAPMESAFSFDMQLVKGTAAYVTGRLGKLAPSAVKIATPQATIGIRGTSFVLKVE